MLNRGTGKWVILEGGPRDRGAGGAFLAGWGARGVSECALPAVLIRPSRNALWAWDSGRSPEGALGQEGGSRVQ